MKQQTNIKLNIFFTSNLLIKKTKCQETFNVHYMVLSHLHR